MRITKNVAAFDRWIRGDFRAMNTELEERYFASAARHQVAGVGEDIKRELLEEGRELVAALLHEGNTDEGADNAYALLGGVGLYMAACRRHELTEPSRETTSPLLEASALALHLATTLGVTPRFATAHLTTHNRAVDGAYRSFTSLPDEYLFLDYNALGVLAYQRAADALRRALPLGVSHPLSRHLFAAAEAALEEVAASNEVLFSRLDPQRFFYSVRPYYKPYRVGPNIYRGANAGDFAGINIIDLLLGLCAASDPAYSQILVDKFLFMLPEEQELLKDCMRRRSFLDQFLDTPKAQTRRAWYQDNLRAFLRVIAAHGRTAAQHHDQLVRRFIEAPAAALPEEALENITASGPPLPALLDALQKLRDLRVAAERDDIPSRHGDLRRLRGTLEDGAG